MTMWREQRNHLTVWNRTGQYGMKRIVWNGIKQGQCGNGTQIADVEQGGMEQR